jgi:hypothetical protein
MQSTIIRTAKFETFLHEMAQKYIWWKTPAEAVKFPARVVAQVMELGDIRDNERLIELAGRPHLRDILTHAEAGWFSPRSWHFWHYRLGLSAPGEVPPLPERKIP